VLDILAGNGNGTFTAAVSIATVTDADILVVDDFNGDYVPDVAAMGNSGGTAIRIHMANAVSSPYLPVLSVRTQGDALETLERVKSSLSRITAYVGRLGASQSRIETAASNLRQVRENVDAAASRIMDVDVAVESSQLTKTSILQQAGASVLAQANQQPSLALQLLRNV